MASRYPENIKIDSQIDEKLKDISDHLDLKQAPPINQKRLVTFFNHFVITMVDFINTFSQSCSYRLFKFEQRINEIEAELCLLESKLNSIPELADENKLPPAADTKKVEVDSSEPPPTPEVTPEPEEKKEAPDPRINKYVKMVQFGVPVEAVKVKMRLEGVDPTLLK